LLSTLTIPSPLQPISQIRGIDQNSTQTIIVLPKKPFSCTEALQEDSLCPCLCAEISDPSKSIPINNTQTSARIEENTQKAGLLSRHQILGTAVGCTRGAVDLWKVGVVACQRWIGWSPRAPAGSISGRSGRRFAAVPTSSIEARFLARRRRPTELGSWCWYAGTEDAWHTEMGTLSHSNVILV